ncbi:MAG: serine hydrolase [Clostridia bacterium]|nr:serine hydrolase [Clostridia bacterium]
MDHMKEMRVLESIREEMSSIPGHLGFYYKNLATGYEFGVREDEAFSAASVIKLPLFMHVLRESAAGRMSMDEKLVVTEEDKVPICGALTLFTGPVEADVRTLCRLMISISDNTATNKLIRHSTIPGAMQGFREMGLERTELQRCLFDSTASKAGLRNVICPKEMGMLLEKLYRGEFVSPEVSKEAMDVLLLQQVDHKLNGKICGEVAIAHKTGEDDELSNDVGVVLAEEPFVVCFVGHDTDVYRWEDLMRRGTYELLKAQENEIREFILDGERFDDMEGFYQEIDRLLTKDLPWETGHNLDAFNDLLRGGFGVHEYGEPIRIKWIHHGKSRRDLGEEMIGILKEIILDSDGTGHNCQLELCE